jgi:hypothetical protein
MQLITLQRPLRFIEVVCKSTSSEDDQKKYNT